MLHQKQLLYSGVKSISSNIMDARRVCLMFCLLLLAHCTLQQTSSKKRNSKKVCLRGTKIQGKCFLSDPVKKTFHAASEDCFSKGGSLSTPLTGDENEQLYQYVRQSIGPEEPIWLGVNDMVTEGQWLDQSGSSVRFKNWETEITLQPDGGRSQNCGLLSTTAHGKWFDESCRAEKASVCEFNIV
ncbi:hypothetical protein F7725_018685 [Dissostichus mawsoni]|uniref:C-type lectin domain-containing protein n=1 Tax=Dissostichus mawsoni TaxID=36200 RepID=A0A7J5XV07_DISMA|nr:hypothetical protein F7725_018685 [Dissostichus mawsoni]